MLIILLKPRVGRETAAAGMKRGGRNDGADRRRGRGPPARPDDDRRGGARRGVADHRLAGAQQRARRAAVDRDPAAGARCGARARLHAAAARRGAVPGRLDGDRPSSPTRSRPTPGARCSSTRVRERAWENGLTVAACVSHSDADLEAALLAQLVRQPLVGLIYAHDPDPAVPAEAGALPGADGAAQLLRPGPFAGLGVPGGAARRLRRDAGG